MISWWGFRMKLKIILLTFLLTIPAFTFTKDEIAAIQKAQLSEEDIRKKALLYPTVRDALERGKDATREGAKPLKPSGTKISPTTKVKVPPKK